jgi:hypothetical protein
VFTLLMLVLGDEVFERNISMTLLRVYDITPSICVINSHLCDV